MAVTRLIKFYRLIDLGIIKKIIASSIKHRLMGSSSEMAFHAMLAIFPGILSILTALSIFELSLKPGLVDLVQLLKGIIPLEVWSLLFDFVRGIDLSNGQNWFSISFFAGIWIFSGVLSAASYAFDRIHEVSPSQQRSFWKTKLVSILLSIGTILLLITASFLIFIGDLIVEIGVNQNWNTLLLVVWKILSGPIVLAILATSLASIYRIYKLPQNKKYRFIKARLILLIIIVNTFLLKIIDLFIKLINYLINEPETNHTISSILLGIWRLLSWPVALGIVAVCFAFIYKFAVSHRDSKTPLMPGAILAAVAWMVVSALFRLYVSNFGYYNKIYGAVGAVIVLMLWLYLSCFVMLLGDVTNAVVGQEIQKKTKLIDNLK